METIKFDRAYITYNVSYQTVFLLRVWLKPEMVLEKFWLCVVMVDISYVAYVELKILELCFLRWRHAVVQAKVDMIEEMHWAAIVCTEDSMTIKDTKRKRRMGEHVNGLRNGWSSFMLHWRTAHRQSEGVNVAAVRGADDKV